MPSFYVTLFIFLRVLWLHEACIIAVSVKKNLPREIALKMEHYGWSPGVRHAVTIMSAEPTGKWLDVADDIRA